MPALVRVLFLAGYWIHEITLASSVECGRTAAQSQMQRHAVSRSLQPRCATAVHVFVFSNPFARPPAAPLLHH